MAHQGWPSRCSGDGTQGPHQPPARLQTCIACPTPPPLFPLSSPQCPTIALVMGPKGLISRLLALTLNNACPAIPLVPPLSPPQPPLPCPSHFPSPHYPTIALVMGPKGLCPTIALVMGPKGLISPPYHSIALVMGLKGLICRLLAPKFIGVCPAL
ncbi:unnamed protein product [Closterium sp. NIES-65]|nr:unnamed protein product [Closterium sp. NIES-65]